MAAASRTTLSARLQMKCFEVIRYEENINKQTNKQTTLSARLEMNVKFSWCFPRRRKDKLNKQTNK